VLGGPFTTAELVIRRLEDHGVRHVFGIPGTHNLPLYRHLAGSSIRHVLVRHEQAGVFAADGYARASGHVAVCVTTTGPGLLNSASAAATAYADSVPVLIISPGLPDGIEDRELGFLHQAKSQSRAMREVIGRSFRASGPAEAVELIDRAFDAFASQRPRPFHLELPLDVLDDSAAAAPGPPPAASARPGPTGAIEQAVDTLVDARSGAIVLGGGAVDAAPEAHELARRLQMPVATSVNGKGVVSERDPLSMGASVRLPACQEVLREAEVVLAVGTELAESDLWCSPPLPLDGRMIRVDLDPDQLRRNAVPDLGLVADAREALSAIAARVPARPQRDRGASRAVTTAAACRREARRDAGEPIAELIDTLGACLGPETVIAGDSAMACYYGVAHLLDQEAPRRFLYPTGYATLGYGLAAGIGAKLAHPASPVLVVLGDGGALFTLAELGTAVELQLPLPILVCNNGGYGEIRRVMVERGQEPLGVDFDRPDFVAVARAFGADGSHVSRPAELPALLERAFATPGPTLLELAQPRC